MQKKKEGADNFYFKSRAFGNPDQTKKTFASGNGGDEKSLHPEGSKFIL